MKNIEVDFGARKLAIDVPQSAVVAEFQEPERHSDPRRAVEEAIANPIGAPSLESLIKPGMTVAIGHDDPTKPPPPLAMYSRRCR